MSNYDTFVFVGPGGGAAGEPSRPAGPGDGATAAREEAAEAPFDREPSPPVGVGVGVGGGAAVAAPPAAATATATARDLLLCVLAWACTVAGLALVVGASNVAFLSVGGDPRRSSVPLGAFFAGAGLVSFSIAPRLFVRRGRKAGFLAGVACGLVGSVLGALSVVRRSAVALVVACGWFGMAVGVGFHLRFAALELVTAERAERAVTLVVAGGCIAAFAGPESAEAARGMFGDECEFLGVFLVTGACNVANGAFTCLVRFPPVSNGPRDGRATSEDPQWKQIRSVVRRRHFVVPVAISALSWIVMALPMSVLRVAMHDAGFPPRWSLLAIELHFLGMYSPGFVSGRWIAKHGPRRVSAAAVPVFLAAFALMMSAGRSSGSSPPGAAVAPWILGMVVVGFGWNLAFNASTVGLTRSYARRPESRPLVQAANEGLTFLLAGTLICCAGAIYQAGGGGMEGWRAVNWAVLGFVALLSSVLALDVVLERGEGETPADEKWSAPSKAFDS